MRPTTLPKARPASSAPKGWAQSLCDCLRQWTRLRQLHLEQCRLTSQTFDVVSTGIRQCHELQEFICWGNKLGDYEDTFRGLLRDCSQLRITAGDCGLSPSTVKRLEKEFVERFDYVLGEEEDGEEEEEDGEEEEEDGKEEEEDGKEEEEDGKEEEDTDIDYVSVMDLWTVRVTTCASCSFVLTRSEKTPTDGLFCTLTTGQENSGLRHLDLTSPHNRCSAH
ncbi:hypothetical protein NP493_2708g00013 [Ridgeia piscesae]|uniref:Uncharacterized protein n=1 Tax=Ridgeia piscesae TaxID=27915 RepID=A0AAD9JEH8_RIDPI|nr:hypothetical protein NP493_2708g00013 [Ridgeia piscesae]